MGTQSRAVRMWASLPAMLLVTTAAVLSGPAFASHRDGKQVVDAVCGACHTPGKDGAPRIGDSASWGKRAALGLSSLTEHAIQGIRNMPAHGGNQGVSDLEIQGAIVYMVNQSGGRWVEPVAAAHGARRGADALVESQCAKCHQPGTEGAPKIGDRAAWTPRLAKGLDALVASAVHGHGGMPARGGAADLEREEIRSAILYMFNHGLPPPVAPVETTARNPRHRMAGGMDIFFGVVSAEAVRTGRVAMRHDDVKVQVPKGKDYYHLNISLAEQRSQAPVADAQVTVRVSDGLSVQTKTLGTIASNRAVSYGEFFRFERGNAYNIQTEIRRPGLVSPVVANFEYRAP